MRKPKMMGGGMMMKRYVDEKRWKDPSTTKKIHYG